MLMNFQWKKKNPLVLPPEFGELPAPKETKFTKQTNKENKIEDLFSKDIKSLEESTISNSNSDIEKSVLQKIKNK